ncbi:unnamed protein product [Pieris brassicae]|uniref:PAS domain-containing protein n=1 Tax=Pieris brassicae TaxID=7116 RepID=A0A9P0T1C6_PIEBR|nr:unnamed protein product [Pieris brassicae]
MESALLNFNRVSCASAATTPNVTPIKPRLGRFVDFYSPEHLNITPKPKPRFVAAITNENRRFSTPEKCLDIDNRCRTVKAQKNNQNVWRNCSFEGNQSFPRLKHHIRSIKMDLETPTKVKTSVDLVRVDGHNGLRFNTSLASGDVTSSPAQSQTDRLQQNITNKAVFTIEPNTSKILIVNNKACSLLGYSSGELCDLCFSDLLHNRSNQKKFSLHAEDGDTSEDGTAVLLGGKRWDPDIPSAVLQTGAGSRVIQIIVRYYTTNYVNPVNSENNIQCKEISPAKYIIPHNILRWSWKGSVLYC